MLEEKLSLEGKKIVITGGGTGLGLEMTTALARAGADLVIASRRQGPIDEAAQIVRDLGRKAVAVSTDVTPPLESMMNNLPSKPSVASRSASRCK